MGETASQSIVEELLDALLAGPEPEVFAVRAAEVAADRLRLPAPGGVSLAIERSRRTRLTARTASLPEALASVEYEPGSPGSTVLGGGPDVVVEDFAADRRWQAMVPAAAAGIRSAVAAALPLDGGRGVLSCYAAQRQAFGSRGAGEVLAVAGECAKVLRLALLLDARAYRAANLQAALESRTVVDLAAGIIMGQNGCSQQAAIDILRSVSNSRNIKIRNVAAGVVAAVSDRVNTHFEE